MRCQVTSKESVKVLRCTLEVGHHTWAVLTCLELSYVILAYVGWKHSSCESDLCHDTAAFESGLAALTHMNVNGSGWKADPCQYETLNMVLICALRPGLYFSFRKRSVMDVGNVD